MNWKSTFNPLASAFFLAVSSIRSEQSMPVASKPSMASTIAKKPGPVPMSSAFLPVLGALSDNTLNQASPTSLNSCWMMSL